MKRFLIALAFAVLLMTGFQGMAWAQSFRINGGLDLQPLRPYLGFTVTVERPSLDLLGVRWGPLGTFKANTDFQGANAQLLLGIGGAAVLPDTAWAVKVKILTSVEFQTGQPLTVGPEFQVAFSSQF